MNLKITNESTNEEIVGDHKTMKEFGMFKKNGQLDVKKLKVEKLQNRWMAYVDPSEINPEIMLYETLKAAPLNW